MAFFCFPLGLWRRGASSGRRRKETFCIFLVSFEPWAKGVSSMCRSRETFSLFCLPYIVGRRGASSMRRSAATFCNFWVFAIPLTLPWGQRSMPPLWGPARRTPWACAVRRAFGVAARGIDMYNRTWHRWVPKTMLHSGSKAWTFCILA